jgi:ATP-dependent DNA ligase
MKLPVSPPIEPMLAKLVDAIPEKGDFIFEPKWDGFRTLVFRDGDFLLLQSRDKKPMNRYFPELEAPLLASLPARCVLDGEIVLVRNGRLDFDALQQRIHPAKSRVKILAAEMPCAFVAFDLLALDDEDLTKERQDVRRTRLEEVLAGVAPPVYLTPATRDPAVARAWFRDLEGAGLDGVIAKPTHLAYAPKKRVLFKIKHQRTADCVVAGFRWYKNGVGTHVGSLLLGLFDDEGTLHHVGVTSAFTMKKRAELVKELAPLRENAKEGHPWAKWAAWEERAEGDLGRMPGGMSRWSHGKDLSWEPLRCERVCEVKYDFMQGDRFRHATTFLWWRTDKAPTDCRYDQLEEPTPYDLRRVLGG